MKSVNQFLTNKLTRSLVAATLVASVAPAAFAQSDYPNRPIKLVVGFAPGGAADTTARTVSEALARELGQPIVVENRPGAGSSIAAEMVTKADPDGYTILIASPSAISVNPAINPKLRYKGSDLLPITQITSSPLVLAVNPKLGVNSVQELIALAKQKPGTLNYATSGMGSAPHLGGALLKDVAGIDVVHVPYKGGAPAIQSVVAGDTQMTIGTPPSVMPQVKAGNLKALAVTKKDGSKLFADLPSASAVGLPEFDLDFWYGFFVPLKTPDAVVQKIFDATQRAMKDQKVIDALAVSGTEVAVSGSQQAFKDFLVGNEKFWVNLVKSAGVTAE